jgi:hypothetical protein
MIRLVEVAGRTLALPNFLGIGAPQSGTTWLYENLRQHPEVWLTPHKEIHYFDKRYHSRMTDDYFRMVLRNRMIRHFKALYDGNVSLSEILWEIHFWLGIRTNRWYVSLFHPRPGQIAGEITPTYMTLDINVIEEIKGLSPALKIILLMRNPLERVWSSAVKVLARQKNRPVDAVPESEFIAHFNRADINLRTDYLHALHNWESVFGSERIFVGFLDEIRQAPRDLVLHLYRFLEISDSEECIPVNVAQKVNPTGKYRTAIPEVLQIYLARQYMPQLEILSQRFGEPVNSWLRQAKDILRNAN